MAHCAQSEVLWGRNIIIRETDTQPTSSSAFGFQTRLVRGRA
jgi:hypothetical protein